VDEAPEQSYSRGKKRLAPIRCHRRDRNFRF
jgi:hypothetical protein